MANESKGPKKHHQLYKFFPLAAIPGIFLFHNLNYFRELLFYSEVYWLMAGYLLLPFVFYFLFSSILNRPIEQSIIVAALTALFFFFFGALQDFFLQHSITKIIGKTYILPLFFLIPAVYVLKRRPNTTAWLRSLHFTLLFFLLSECFLLIWNLPDFSQVPLLNKSETLKQVKVERQDKLNIHHIVFDGYTNTATLKKLFNFKNPLDSFLLKEGFFIAGRTKSNYNFTPYSLAATLNMQYLELNNKQLVRDFKNYLWGAKVYQQNSVFRFFESQQYSTSYYAVLDNNKHLDKLGTFVPKTPHYSMRYQTLERIVMNPWLWHKVAGASKEMIPPAVKASLRYYVQYNQQALNHALQPEPAPHFRFTHFLLPHEPYVFSKSSVDSLLLSDLMDHNKGYIKQVEYANGLIKKLITELKKNSRNIIILQGDHGFRNYDHSRHSPYTQNETLNTFYFPDQNYRFLYDSISPVNTYRLLLSQYFHHNLPLLKDSAIVPRE
ncbi:MAG TPA: hypothetical protein VGN63_18225 [Flavisolibacter sp.]|jgi:hypothetical protein|nr:hypothetical protein [Flavisolibacter sp.]